MLTSLWYYPWVLPILCRVCYALFGLNYTISLKPLPDPFILWMVNINNTMPYLFDNLFLFVSFILRVIALDEKTFLCWFHICKLFPHTIVSIFLLFIILQWWTACLWRTLFSSINIHIYVWLWLFLWILLTWFMFYSWFFWWCSSWVHSCTFYASFLCFFLITCCFVNVCHSSGVFVPGYCPLCVIIVFTIFTCVHWFLDCC